MLAKSKLDNIETLVSQALTYIEISHEEPNAIIRENQKYEKMQENVRNVNEKQDNMRRNSVNSKKNKLWTWDWLKIIVKHNQKLLNIHTIKKKHFCVRMYKMVDISAETWNKSGISVIWIHENDNVNKTVLLLLWISDISKRLGGGNIYKMIDKKIKGKYGLKKMNERTKQQIRKFKIDRSRLLKGSKESMYVSEVTVMPIIMQTR